MRMQNPTSLTEVKTAKIFNPGRNQRLKLMSISMAFDCVRFTTLASTDPQIIFLYYPLNITCNSCRKGLERLYQNFS